MENDINWVVKRLEGVLQECIEFNICLAIFNELVISEQIKVLT